MDETLGPTVVRIRYFSMLGIRMPFKQKPHLVIRRPSLRQQRRIVMIHTDQQIESFPVPVVNLAGSRRKFEPSSFTLRP